MRETPYHVAIYWDFENLQASLVEKRGGFGAYGRTKFQHQEPLIDIESVMEYAATFGVVSINRAYCNWQWYGKYREALLHNGLELIQLFHPGASGKNGGDIKLCLDCTEDLLRFPHIDVVVIVGGDSDYLPLVQKIKAQGKMLVGIGAQANTNRHWAHSCHEFKFYEGLILDDEPVRRPAPSPAAPPVPVSPTAPPAVRPVTDPDNLVQALPEDLLRRAILRLASKSGDPWVLKGSIRPMMKRLDSTFEEEQHGVKTFSSFMKKFENLIEVRAGKYDQEVRLRESDKSPVQRPVESVPEKPVEPRTQPQREKGRGKRQERSPSNQPKSGTGNSKQIVSEATGKIESEPVAKAIDPDLPVGVVVELDASRPSEALPEATVSSADATKAPAKRTRARGKPRNA